MLCSLLVESGGVLFLGQYKIRFSHISKVLGTENADLIQVSLVVCLKQPQ